MGEGACSSFLSLRICTTTHHTDCLLDAFDLFPQLCFSSQSLLGIHITSCFSWEPPANLLHNLFIARIAAPEFVKRHPKDIGIFAKAEDIEDCPAPCDFYIRSVEEPVKREVELVKESEDIEDCPAPCDFYIRSVDEPEPAKREVELVKESEDLEDCAAPCDFYIRSEVSPFQLLPASWYSV